MSLVAAVVLFLAAEAGVAFPGDAFLSLLAQRKEVKKGRSTEWPACGGFPALRRRFGDRQKLGCGSNSLPVWFPKRPLRSGEVSMGESVGSKSKNQNPAFPL
jgi:hypothetical protein